jgi:hypothetical protein
MNIKKIKLAIATSALVIGGIAGFAAADNTAGNARPDRAERMKMHEARKAKLLEKFDTNRDGKLDDTERAAARETRAVARFNKLDANGDGKLSFDEFKAGRQARGGMHRHHRGPDRGPGRGSDRGPGRGQP